MTVHFFKKPKKYLDIYCRLTWGSCLKACSDDIELSLKPMQSLERKEVVRFRLKIDGYFKCIALYKNEIIVNDCNRAKVLYDHYPQELFTDKITLKIVIWPYDKIVKVRADRIE